MFQGFFFVCFLLGGCREASAATEGRERYELSARKPKYTTYKWGECSSPICWRINTTSCRIYQHYESHIHQMSCNTTGSQISLGLRHDSPHCFLPCFTVSSGDHQQGQQGPYNRITGITAHIQGLITWLSPPDRLQSWSPPLPGILVVVLDVVKKQS